MASKKETKKAGAGPFESLRALKDDLKKKDDAATTATAKKPPAPPPKPATRATPAVADDDAMTMHRLFAGVEPLDRARRRVPRQPIERSEALDRLPDEIAKAARAEADAVQARLRTLVEGGTRFEVEDDGARVVGRRVDLPIDVLRRLRRGSMPIDARLDLHGMTVQQSRVELESFLRTMRGRGERCVLVIHGKGEHSPGGAGVLRGEIAAWLAQSAASQHVAAFATAAAADGGEGAVYVLLRR